MSKLRSSSICPTCSGRSEYFFKQDKGIVLEETCRASLGYCFTSLKMTFKLLKQLRWLAFYYPVFFDKHIDLQTTKIFDSALFQSFYADLSSQPVFSLVEKLTVAEAQSHPEAKSICNEYFNLAKERYVQLMTSELLYGSINAVAVYHNVAEPIKVYSAKIAAEMPALDAALAKKLELWEKQKTGSSRLLENANLAFGDWFFSSDTAIISPDDDYLHHSLAITETHNDHKECILHKPMNLTVQFP